MAQDSKFSGLPNELAKEHISRMNMYISQSSSQFEGLSLSNLLVVSPKLNYDLEDNLTGFEICPSPLLYVKPDSEMHAIK